MNTERVRFANRLDSLSVIVRLNDAERASERAFSFFFLLVVWYSGPYREEKNRSILGQGKHGTAYTVESRKSRETIPLGPDRSLFPFRFAYSSLSVVDALTVKSSTRNQSRYERFVFLSSQLSRILFPLDSLKLSAFRSQYGASTFVNQRIENYETFSRVSCV